jgi:hypothetical protein
MPLVTDWRAPSQNISRNYVIYVIMKPRFAQFHTVTLQPVTLEEATTLETTTKRWLRTHNARGHATRQMHLDTTETHVFQARLHPETTKEQLEQLVTTLEPLAPHRVVATRLNVTFLGVPVQQFSSGRVKEYAWQELRDVRPRRHPRAA